jgi:L-rhamnose mutarotase
MDQNNNNQNTTKDNRLGLAVLGGIVVGAFALGVMVSRWTMKRQQQQQQQKQQQQQQQHNNKRTRIGFVMSVNEGDEIEYEKRHSPIWTELSDMLKARGVHNYSIFLHSETRQLFAYVEVDSVVNWESIAETNICHKWWTYMGDVMPSNPDGSPKGKPLREVFHLH